MASTRPVLDETVKHRIYLSRYSTTLVRRVLAQLNRVDADLVARIMRADNAGLSTFELERVLDEVRALQADGWAVVRSRLTDDLAELAAIEAEWNTRLIRSAAKLAGIETYAFGPTGPQVVAAVNARPFQGKFLRDWLSEAEAGAAKRVRETIRQGFIEGRTVSQIASSIRGTRALQFRDGILEVSRRGAETMVRTAVTHTASVASEETYKAFGDIIAGVEWVSILDSRTTPICAGRDGKVYPVDSGPRPPAHPNCLLGDSLVSTGVRVTGGFKRWYDGDVVVIRTAGGKALSCTPNHPILTRAGWVAAGLLNEGGDVICDAGIERVPLIDGHDQNVKARIEDIAEALFASEKMLTVPVPTAAEDFHGDGVDGEVAVVATDRSLHHGIEPTLAKHRTEGVFSGRCVKLSKVAGDGSFAPLFFTGHPPTGGIVGLCGEAGALFRPGALHSGALLGATVSKGMASAEQNALDGPWAATKVLGDTPHADAIEVQALDLALVEINSPPATAVNFHADAAQAGGDSRVHDAELARHLIDGLAGPVATDIIICIERRRFAGHVYNLETSDGWYVAENIITHNCRSTTIARVRGLDPIERQTYSEWLKGQPAAVQNEVLGKGKADLFRSGAVSLDRFTDPAGKVLTLEQLRARSGLAKPGL